MTVTFEGQGVDDEDYKAQLALDLGSGEGPDVFSIDGPWVGEFALAEYIAPLADVVSSSEQASQRVLRRHRSDASVVYLVVGRKDSNFAPGRPQCHTSYC